MKTTLSALQLMTAFLAALSPGSHAATWKMSDSWSTTSNPNGAWSYGYRTSASGENFGLLTYMLNGTFWLRGWGIWSPSIQADPLVHSGFGNAYAVVRWTCPETGYYKIESAFTGWDSRGVDILVWVVTGGQPVFSGEVHGYLNSAPYTNTIALQKDAYLDFIVAWDTRVPSYDGGWTYITGIISSAEPPPPPPWRLSIRTSQVELCWDTTTNLCYQLQYRSELTTNNWIPFTTNWLRGDGTRYCTNDAVLPGVPQRFYRVEATNAPPQP
jgi:hypothetical protein